MEDSSSTNEYVGQNKQFLLIKKIQNAFFAFIFKKMILHTFAMDFFFGLSYDIIVFAAAAPFNHCCGCVDHPGNHHF